MERRRCPDMQTGMRSVGSDANQSKQFGPQLRFLSLNNQMVTEQFHSYFNDLSVGLRDNS